jgi:hypothetical protein
LLSRVARQVQQGVYIGDGHALGYIRRLRDLIACADLAFLKHSQVKARPMMSHEQSSHFRLFHSDAHAVARHTWLSHFDERAANPVTIADAHSIVG